MRTVRLGQVRYDTATSAFEARVDVERDGRTFRYPCRVEAPESTPRDWIEQALTRHALRQPDTGPIQPRPH